MSFMYITRYYDNLEVYFEPKRVLILFGPRRVGKTTLLNDMLERLKKENLKIRVDSGDNIRIQQTLGSQDFQAISQFVGDNEMIALDEAQLIPNIGMGLKIIVDQHPAVQVIATGSSSFDLAMNVGEPLTGRKTTLTLYPVAQLELLPMYNNSQYDLRQRLEEYLIFGSYPEVLTEATQEGKIKRLDELVSSYLFKDILALEGRKGSRFVTDLVKMLALQVGSEVSINELATALGAHQTTIERYLDLLEQTFVIYRLGSFSRNLRSELRHKQKYFFIDNGVRNAIIRQYNSLDSRTDVGALWENFVFMERLKKRSYQNIYSNVYFWRTHEKQEVDFVEERDGKLFGFEVKWSEKSRAKAPSDWLATYPEAEYQVVTPDNYLDFIV